MFCSWPETVHLNSIITNNANRFQFSRSTHCGQAAQGHWSMKPETIGLVIGLALGTLLLSWLGCRLGRRRRCRHPHPKKWKRLGSLGEIHLYPVKSAASIEVEQVECTYFGLKIEGWRDRSLVAVDAKGKYATAGKYARMLNIQPSLEDPDLLCVTAPNMDVLTIDLMKVLSTGQMHVIQREGFQVPLVECGEEHHKWFSKVILQRDSGLKMHVELDPIVDKNWQGSIPTERYAIMALHRKSVEDLNRRLGVSTRVDPKQFRSNLIIESDEKIAAYDEDKWMWLRIGSDPGQEVILRFNSDCLRCIVVNVDAGTHRRNANFEPLKTLKKYRLTTHPRDPAMGVYFDVYQNGVLKKGDPIYVQYK